eukprot:3701507-Amphidinium_carterae.1
MSTALGVKMCLSSLHSQRGSEMQFEDLWFHDVGEGENSLASLQATPRESFQNDVRKLWVFGPKFRRYIIQVHYRLFARIAYFELLVKCDRASAVHRVGLDRSAV